MRLPISDDKTQTVEMHGNAAASRKCGPLYIALDARGHAIGELTDPDGGYVCTNETLKVWLQEILDGDARAVATSAASPAHPLHDELEWDETKAAKEGRLARCAEIIETYGCR